MSAQPASFLSNLDLSAGVPDPDRKKSFVDQLDLTAGIREDQYQPPEDKPWTSDLGEIGRQLAGGVVVGVPQQAGQALKWMSEPGKPLYETGQRWVQSAEQRAPAWEPDLEGRGPVAETLIKGAQQVGPSVAGPLTAAGLMAAAPFEIPAAVALGVGALAGAIPMGMAQGQESYENVIEAGGTPEEALKAGRINQAIETGGETLGNVALGGMLGAGRRALFPTKPVADAIRSVTDTGILKPLAKSVGGAMVTEPLTEFGQGFGEAATEQAYGVPNLDPVQQGLEGAQTAIGMTALGIPVGAVGHTVQARRNAAIGQVLSDPATAPEERSKAAEILAGQIAQVDPVAAQQAQANVATAIQQGLPLPFDETVASPDLFKPPAGPLSKAAQEAVTTGASTVEAANQAAIDVLTGGSQNGPGRTHRISTATGAATGGGAERDDARAGRIDAGAASGGNVSGLGVEPPGAAPQSDDRGGVGRGALIVDPETGEILNPPGEPSEIPGELPRTQQTGLALQRAAAARPEPDAEGVNKRVRGLFGRVDRGIESAVQDWEKRGSEGAIEDGPIYQRMREYLNKNLAPYLGDERTPEFIDQLINGADREALASELADAMGGRRTGATNAAESESVPTAPGDQAEQQPAPELAVPAAAPAEEELARRADAGTEAGPPPAAPAPAVEPEVSQAPTEQRVVVPMTRSREMDEWRKKQRAQASVAPDETPTVPQETSNAQQDTQTETSTGWNSRYYVQKQGDGRFRLASNKNLNPISPAFDTEQEVERWAGENLTPQPGGSAPADAPQAAVPGALDAGQSSEAAQARVDLLPGPGGDQEGAMPPGAAVPSPPTAEAAEGVGPENATAALLPPAAEISGAEKNRPSTLPVAPRNESAQDDAMVPSERSAARFEEGEKANTFHIVGNADEIQARLKAAKVPPGTKLDDQTVRLNNMARQKAEAALLPPTARQDAQASTSAHTGAQVITPAGETSGQSTNQAPQGAAGHEDQATEAQKESSGITSSASDPLGWNAATAEQRQEMMARVFPWARSDNGKMMSRWSWEDLGNLRYTLLRDAQESEAPKGPGDTGQSTTPQETSNGEKKAQAETLLTGRAENLPASPEFSAPQLPQPAAEGRESIGQEPAQANRPAVGSRAMLTLSHGRFPRVEILAENKNSRRVRLLDDMDAKRPAGTELRVSSAVVVPDVGEDATIDQRRGELWTRLHRNQSYPRSKLNANEQRDWGREALQLQRDLDKLPPGRISDEGFAVMRRIPGDELIETWVTGARDEIEFAKSHSQTMGDAYRAFTDKWEGKAPLTRHYFARLWDDAVSPQATDKGVATEPESQGDFWGDAQVKHRTIAPGTSINLDEITSPTGDVAPTAAPPETLQPWMNAKPEEEHRWNGTRVEKVARLKGETPWQGTVMRVLGRPGLDTIVEVLPDMNAQDSQATVRLRPENLHVVSIEDQAEQAPLAGEGVTPATDPDAETTAAPKTTDTVTAENNHAVDVNSAEQASPPSLPSPVEGEGVTTAEHDDGNPKHLPTDTTGQAGDEDAGAGAVRATEDERRAGELRGAEGRDDAERVRRADQRSVVRHNQREGEPGRGGTGATGDRTGATDLGRDRREPSRVSRGNDYRIQPGELTRRGSWFDSARRNVEAVELVARLEQEQRAPTKEEQALLAQFVGWGPGEIRNNLFPSGSGIGKNYNPYYARGEQWRELAQRIKEVFTAEDWKTVARSTQYAHYTSEKIIRSIYGALGRLGFVSGSMLEPGAGIGLFAGLMPDAMYRDSTYLGIELDGFTARIAQHLFPSQTIRHGDYTRQKLPKNFFDVAIGNPPFADIKVMSDPDYRKQKFLLHDYFFAKTLDSVRPGGLLVFVTSNGTMDKKSSVARDYLSERADLLGAIRLPQTAFKDNAGTEVVTDVLFLRKRAPGAEPAGPTWQESVALQVEGTEQFVNEYFVAHPEMVLGVHSAEGSMYAGKSYTMKPIEGAIEDLFAKAVENLPQNVYSVLMPTVPVKTIQARTIEREFNPKHRKEGGVYLNDDSELMRVEFGVGVPLSEVEKALSAKDRAFLTDYVPLRDALKQAQYDQLTEGDWEASLKALNTAYESFVQKHGPIGAYTLTERREVDEDGNPVVVQAKRLKNERVLRMDVEYTLLFAMETTKEDGTIEKGPVLKGRVLKQPTEPKVETISDALAVSLANTGAFDIDHVAQLYGFERADAVRMLGDLVYELPSGGYVMADAYLSGDVKAKLDEAVIAADHQPRYARNVEALQKVQPPQLGAADITVQLGAAWIPEKYVSIFGREVLGIEGAVAHYSKATGGWTVSGKAGKYVSRSGSAEWGTNYRSPTELLDAVLNKRQIRVYDTINDGSGKKSVFNEEATVAANDIAKRMADEFGSWVWTDSRRAGQLLTLYNETFNRYSPREFNGDHLNPPGMSLKYKLHPHQKRAVWRQIQTGNTYLAHAVGAGKTLEMIIGGMEQKRLGLIDKPMYVVPNHMLNQFAREFMEAYPAANILVADEQNFHTDNRRRFIAQAAFNAPDAIVITHSAFKILQLKPENKAAAYDAILEDLRDQLEELDGDDQATKRSRREIENRIERLEQQLEGKTKSEKKDSALYFEDLGVDFLYVDEAHAYRKLDYGTNMKVKGLSPEGSQQALDLYAKTRWLNSQRPGRAYAFASGTPITNSMAEMFTVQRFFQEDLLRKEGLHHFDAWASMFGRVAKFYEKNATGAIEVVERFGKFVNVYDMMSRALEFMDVLTSPQLANLIRVPDVRPGNAGRRELVSVEQSENLAQYLAGELTSRLEESRKWKPTRDEPSNPDPVIAIIGDGRLAAIDFRYVDPSLPNDLGSKLNRMCDEIIRIHQETADLDYTDPETGEKAPIKGATQIVFASNGFGEGVIRNRGFDSRAWVMKRFKDAGIKASEVAWIWDYPDAAKKEAMFKEMREGKKRILIGSPKNMGTGVNVQRRLLALHHLDAPWYPSDLEQPEGRIVRQGNQNRQVQIYGYATDGTYDSTMWTMVAQKSGFIEQAFKGDRRLRTMDDVSESSQYALAAAIASGDQRYMHLAELEAEVARLETVRKTHDNRQLSLKRDIATTERDIEFKRKALVTAKAVAKELEGQIFYSGYLNGKIGPTVLRQAKTTDVGDALLSAFKEVYDQAVLDAQEKGQGATVKVKVKVDKPLGLINGVRLSAVGEIVAQQNKEGQVEILSLHSELDVEASVGEHDIGRVFGRRDFAADGEQAASKFAALARDATNRPQRLQTAIDEAKQELEGYRARFGAPFSQEQEYLEKLKALEELRRELTTKEDAIDPAALGTTEETDVSDEQLSGGDRVEARRANYDPYTQDMFGQPLPVPDLSGLDDVGAEQPATSEELAGDVEPTGGIRLSSKVDQTRTGEITTGFPKVTTWAEAAHTVAQVRKFPQEHFLTLVLNGDGKVLSVLRHTIGVRDGSQVSPSLVAGSVYGIHGAKQVVFAHNHPSGVSQLSDADRNITKKIAELMRDTGVEVWGMIAVGTKDFGFIDTRYDTGDYGVQIPAAVRRTTIPILERIYRKRGRLLDRSVTGPETAGPMIKELMGSQTGLLLFDNQHYPIGVIPLTAEDTKKLRGEGGPAARILKALHESNAAAAMLVKDAGITAEDARNVGTLISWSDVRMLDVFDENGGSWAAQGLNLSESGGKYYARGRSAPKTHTAASLAQSLRSALKPRGDIAEPLLAAPWFKIVTRENSPRGIEVLHERAGEVLAWYNPATGVVGVVADAIPVDWSAQELRGLVLHEIGVHMRHLGQGDKAWANILQQFEAMEKDDKAVGDAFKRAMRAGVPKSKLQEEALAYYIQEHPDLPFARRVLAWFRQLLRKIGETFQGLNKARWMHWANELTTDDLVAMASGALQQSVRYPRYPDVLPEVTTRITALASRSDDQHSSGLLMSTSDPDGVLAEIDKVTATQGPWREEGNKIRDRWESLKGVAKRHWLGALSVRQLAEIGKSVLPGIGEYVDHMQGMAATRTQVFDRADRVAKDWGVLVPGDAARNRIEQNRLAAVMHEATLAGVDPAEEYLAIIDPKEALNKIGIIRQQMRQRSGESQAVRMQEVKFLQQQMAFERNRKEAYGNLARMFNALSPKAQDIYRRARDFHVEQSKLVEQTLIEMIEQSMLGGKAKAEAIAKLRKEFESNRVQAPYFPLSRQGDYWVVLEPEEGGPVEFHMFQTVEQQERFITEQEKAGATIKGRGKQIENLREVVGVSVGFVEEVENLLKQMGNDPLVNDVRDQVYQLYLTTLPDLSVRKHFIHRKKTPGFGQDALRAFAEKAYHDAYQYARLKHGMPLRQTMEDLRADIEAANRGGKLTDAKKELALLTEFRDIVMGKMSAQQVEDRMIQLEGRALEDLGVKPELEKWTQFDQWMEDWARRGRMPAFVARRTKVLERRLSTAEKIRGKERGYEFAADVYDELQAAYQQLMNPRTSPLANAVNQLGFLWYLGFSPSAWLVNAMQTPMVSLPYAAAKFGFDKSAAAFSRAYKRAFKPDADNLFSIRGSLSGETLKAYNEAVEIGLIDRTRAHDLAGLAEEGTQRSGLNRKLMQISAAGFHHGERLNREVTFIAGFELARQSGMDYSQAVAYAQELVWKTHLDYAAENRPRMLRGNIARVIGQFKLYSQGITYLIGKSFADALNRPGVSVETRKEARRFLAFQFGLQFAAAGALGLPVGAALMVARAMLNGDDDDPEDFDGLFRQAMMEWIGSQTAGAAVSTGLVNALTPIDLHSRLSLSDLWLREPNRELEGRDAAYWVMSSVLGPMAGLLETGLVGAKLINDGQVYRGIEKMLPNALNDAAKAARYATEGAQTLKGDKLLQEITPAESLFQAIGFTPARLEARYAENQARKNVEQRVQDRRSRLLRQAAEARMARDREAIVDTNAAIRAFNEKNPTRRIVGTDIAQSMRMRARQRVQAESGALYNPRMRRELVERYGFATR